MNYKNSKTLTFILTATTTILFNFTLITIDSKLIKERSAAYTKIIKNWNTESWNSDFAQYGPWQDKPMYKVADRKILVDAIFKDIRNKNNKIDPLTAINILTPIAHLYTTEEDEEAAKVINSVKNYIQTTFLAKPAEIIPLKKAHKNNINNYLDNSDAALNESLHFWNHNEISIITLMDNNISNISANNYKILCNACKIGDKLQKCNHLEIFDTHYNILNVVAHQIRQIDGKNHPNQLNILKNKSTSYIQTLYANLPASYKSKQPLFEKFSSVETQKLASSIHKKLEPQTDKILRLYKPANITDCIQTIQDPRLRNIVQNNLQNYAIIQDVRGEGNCGYRAFLGSICMNDFDTKNFTGVETLQRLVQDKFVPLFTKYASNQNNEYKLSVPITGDESKNINFTQQEIQSIQQSMIQYLEDIKKYKSADEIEKLFNTHSEFDFYMIMFLRTLLSDEYSKEATTEEQITAKAMAMAEYDSEIDYFKNLLRWTSWVDNAELATLNKITGITINLIQEQAASNALTPLSTATAPNGQADILFVDNNHYQILRSLPLQKK
ncbi:MAG: hypothetical protein Q8Q60_03500 [Candidatus Chromulinivorax sp.]|nr:hypothetical protein [Candidatus Chromulinivorax sp.]